MKKYRVTLQYEFDADYLDEEGDFEEVAQSILEHYQEHLNPENTMNVVVELEEI